MFLLTYELNTISLIRTLCLMNLNESTMNNTWSLYLMNWIVYLLDSISNEFNEFNESEWHSVNQIILACGEGQGQDAGDDNHPVVDLGVVYFISLITLSLLVVFTYICIDNTNSIYDNNDDRRRLPPSGPRHSQHHVHNDD